MLLANVWITEVVQEVGCVCCGTQFLNPYGTKELYAGKLGGASHLFDIRRNSSGVVWCAHMLDERFLKTRNLRKY